MNFSVLMPVYHKDNSQHFKIALDSVINQTVPPGEIVIVKDGPLSSELESVIIAYAQKYNDLFKVLALDRNVGLGEALRIGLDNCSNDIVARMDSDDYSLPIRFERQMEILGNNPDIDLVGSYIAEFEEELEEIEAVRTVPIMNIDILKYARHRNPVNHVTVMFRKAAVLSSGSYKPFQGFEDYYLWMRMLSLGCTIFNIPEVLVHVRVNGMYKRRGGSEYVKNEKRFQREMLNQGCIDYHDYLINYIVRRLARSVPNGARKFIYKAFLREKCGKNSIRIKAIN